MFTLLVDEEEGDGVVLFGFTGVEYVGGEGGENVAQSKSS